MSAGAETSQGTVLPKHANVALPNASKAVPTTKKNSSELDSTRNAALPTDANQNGVLTTVDNDVDASKAVALIIEGDDWGPKDVDKLNERILDLTGGTQNYGLILTPEIVSTFPAACIVEWEYTPEYEDELYIAKGDVVIVRELAPGDDGWVIAEINGIRGLVPATHLGMALYSRVCVCVCVCVCAPALCVYTRLDLL
jgi:hypothetical protein